MNTSESINEIAAALAKAQGAMHPAIKDATNPHFKSKYADLAANVEAARKPLADHGLSYVQEPVTTAEGIAIATRLMHSSGQWIQFEPLTVPLSKHDAHGVGSAITYARRYALGSALGLVAEDDDGNAAVTRQAAPVAQAAPIPAGYDGWRDDFLAASDNGTEVLRAMFKDSKPEFRDHLTKRDAVSYNLAKKRAAEADAKLVGAAK